MSKHERKNRRALTFSAWLSALGLLSMLSLADANSDPLIHTDKKLLNTWKDVFNNAV